MNTKKKVDPLFFICLRLTFFLVQLQLVEMQNLGKTLSDLETSHLKAKRKYEDEISSLKRSMAGKSNAEKGENSEGLNSGSLDKGDGEGLGKCPLFLSSPVRKRPKLDPDSEM